MEGLMFFALMIFTAFGSFFFFKFVDLVDVIQALGKSHNAAKFVVMTEEGGKPTIYEILGQDKGQYVLKERPDLRTAYASKVKQLN